MTAGGYSSKRLTRLRGLLESHVDSGFGMGIVTHRTHLGPSAGSYGWTGYYGTAWYNDPAENLTAILILQRAYTGETTALLRKDFWTTVYQAIAD